MPRKFTVVCVIYYWQLRQIYTVNRMTRNRQW